MTSLHEKSALVLGASSARGIGAGVAIALRDAGAHVTIAGRNEQRLKATSETLGLAYQVCDATEEGQIEDLCRRVAQQRSGLDIAVFAAGFNHFAPIARLKPETATQTIQTQLVGGLMFIKHAARALESGGSIIMLSSLTASLPAFGTSVYAGTKAAMEHIIRVAALEYGPSNIRINGIAPGLQRTDMTEAMFETPAIEAAAVRQTPLSRLGTPGDAGSAAVWLAQDDCFMTGVTLPISGGAQLQKIPTLEEMAG